MAMSGWRGLLSLITAIQVDYKLMTPKSAAKGRSDSLHFITAKVFGAAVHKSTVCPLSKFTVEFAIPKIH